MTKKIIVIPVIIFSLFSGIWAETTFSGLAGAKLDLSTKKTEEDEQLSLQSFFAGQFSFSKNVWTHLEFSVETSNMLSDDVFRKIEAKFRIDEASLTLRSILSASANYFSVYAGAYNPIGSDILLQRYFGLEPISSNLTDSWLGIGNSNLYPHFGIGAADLVKLYTYPVVFGGYIYLNNEDDDYKVLNFDARGAINLHYFTCDTAIGIGAPLGTKNNDAYLVINKLYWHAGTTLLLGNNYTNSLFLQGGINNAAMKPDSITMDITADTCYLLFEPRFITSNGKHFNFTLYSVPQETADELLFIDNTLGMNLNVYTDIETKKSTFTAGFHLAASYEDKNIGSLSDFSGFNKVPDITITPYMNTKVLSGKLSFLVKMNITKFIDGKIKKGLAFDAGYKCQL